MEELDASRNPGMSFRMKIRFVAAAISLVAVVVIMLTYKGSEPKPVPHDAVIVISTDGSLQWDGRDFTAADLDTTIAAARAKGPLTVTIMPRVGAPPSAATALVKRLTAAGLPEGSVSVDIPIEELRAAEGLKP